MEIERAIEELRQHGLHDDDIAQYLVIAAFEIYAADAPIFEKRVQFQKLAASMKAPPLDIATNARNST